jgi:hypothetical protein
LLQAALQEVLDQHGVLIKNQEASIKQILEEATGQIKASNEYYYGSYEGEGDMPTMNYAEINTQPLIFAGPDQAGSAEPIYGAAVEQGPKTASPAAPTTPQHLRSHRIAHKKGEIIMKQPSGLTRRRDIPNAELPDAQAANSSMVLLGKSPRFLKDKTAMDKDPYHVTSLYWTSGYAQWIARSQLFNLVTLLMLFANMVYIGGYADSERDSVGLEVFEQLFCIFFFVEILIRYASFAVRGDCLRDWCFKFDLILTALMVFESWVLPIGLLMVKKEEDRGDTFQRVVRVLRCARIVRLMRAFPEMVTMARGLCAASWAILSTFVMLLSLVYVFSIVMHTWLQDEVNLPSHWSSVPDSMWTLVLHGVFLDSLGEVVRTFLAGNHYVALISFSLFVLISSAIVMNMLTGILCEAARQLSAAEKENAARAKVRNKVLRMLKAFDVDETTDITKEQLLGVVRDPGVAAVLRALEVDVSHLLEVQDMLYESDDQVLHISQIMNTILELRGDRSATIQDIINGQSFTRWKVQQQLDEQTKFLQEFWDRTVEGLVWQLRGGSGPSRLGQLQPNSQLLQSLSSWVYKQQR